MLELTDGLKTLPKSIKLGLSSLNKQWLMWKIKFKD